MKTEERDSIDFGKTDIRKLFVKLFIPTLMGLIFGSILNIADGIFVGKGVGSDALAAVNIAAPIYLIVSATALMFASGVSVVAAVHLSHGNFKAANINVTQAFTVPTLLMAVVAVVTMVFARDLNYIFGGSPVLEPYVVDYLRYVGIMPVFYLICITGPFVIRLDGAPKYGMLCNVIPSLVNIFLDWLFVFPFHMGIKGAAIATTLSMMLGAVMTMVYMLWFSKTLHFYRLKFSCTSMRLTIRNIGYMAKVGFPTFIADGAICCMIVVGNYMFMMLLHEDGVAAFSVCCYLFPLVFMFGNAITQSQLPIVSYNYGQHNTQRIKATLKLTITVGFVCGMLITFVGIFLCDWLMSLFLDCGTNAFNIAIGGFPLFSLSFIGFTLNLVLIGFLQSIEKARASISLMLLRGLIVLVPVFIALPLLIGERGLWFAVPISETITLIVIIVYFLIHRHRILG